MRSIRIACVLVDHLPLQVEQRLDPMLDSSVIISGLAWKPDTILDTSPDLELPLGMTVQQAKQRYPQAKVIPPHEELCFAQHQTLAQLCAQFTDEIEDAGLGQFFLDVSDMQSLYPTEENLASAILTTVMTTTGLTAQIGLAGNKFTAEQAAHTARARSGTLVVIGGERRFLSQLSISMLPKATDPEILRRLELFGIETLGQFADLSSAAVSRQFGAGAQSVHELARGIDPRPLAVTAPPPSVTQVANFIRDPLHDRYALMRHVEKLAIIIAGSLEVAGYHAEALRVCLTQENGEKLQYANALNPPTADAQRLVLIAQRITSFINLTGPVVSVHLIAYPLRAWHAGTQQLGFFDISSERELRLRQTLETLWTRFGELVIRVASLIGPPLPLKIVAQVDSLGRPKLLNWGGWSRAVAAILDHWRTETRWWQMPEYREHFLVQTDDGATHSIYAQNGNWYLDRKYPW